MTKLNSGRKRNGNVMARDTSRVGDGTTELHTFNRRSAMIAQADEMSRERFQVRYEGSGDPVSLPTVNIAGVRSEFLHATTLRADRPSPFPYKPERRKSSEKIAHKDA